jgi:hypothetical protein
VLESFSIVEDTDPNPPWTASDAWTFHIYANEGGVQNSFQDYHVRGDAGYTKPENATIGQDIPLGVAPGDPVTLRLYLWTKEKDPSTRPSGVSPGDRNRMKTTHTETCAAGEFHFSVFNPVYANPAPPGPDEHNGLVEFRWKWVLEVV